MFPSSCSGNIFSFIHHPLHSPSKNPSSKHSPSQPFLVASTVQEVVPKKKSTTSMSMSKNKTSRKKDRHSKIHTAQGVRDRRMRLSVQIARKFFDLQDMLGFDKASKTIDWLFTKSKEAIKELTASSGCKSTMSSVSHQHKDEKFCHYTFDHHAKESRESARARARERTRRKMVMRSLMSKQSSHEPNPMFLDDMAKFEEPSITHSLQLDQMTSGNYLAMSSTSRPSPFIFSNFISNIAVSSGVNSSNKLEGLSHDWCN